MRLVVSCGSPNWGGLEAMAEALALGLAGRGHEVVVFCKRGSPLHERLEGRIPCEAILQGGAWHPLTLLRAGRALRRHRPHAVIANTLRDPGWTGIPARLLGIPVVYRHELNIGYRDRRAHRVLFGWVPAVHVVNSDSSRRTVLDSVDWIEPSKVRVLHNGIDTRTFEQAPALDLGLSDDSVVFGYVGRCDEPKGIREIAMAWPNVVSSMPTAHLVVAGFGPMEKDFREWLRGSPNVHWLGMKPNVGSVLKTLDVLVAPSVSEGFGLILAEAMAVGTPVIACDATATPEVVSDGVEGRLIPPRDAGALTGAMLELGRDPELRREMGEAGVRRVRRDFTIDLMLDRHEQLLAELISGRSRNEKEPQERTP
jgi:glycosyltransferase involved in cell wall biosynthesis